MTGFDRFEKKSPSVAPPKYFLPAVDVSESKDELLLVADMPGVAPEALEVTVEDGVLTFSGRIAPGPERGLETVHQEFLKGDYFRQFRLPREFLADKVEAVLKAGVVTIRVPRDERSKSRRIPVRAE